MTFKNLIWGLSILSLVATSAHAFDEKYVFIDLDRSFNEYYKTKLADTQLKESADEFNSERNAHVEKYEALQADFNESREEASNTALAQDVRDQKRTLAEEKLVELREQESTIRRFDESRRKQLEDQGRRMRKRIVEEIQSLIRTYARNEGIYAVLDISGQSLNGIPLVLYADNRVDITDDILEQLNKGKE